MRVILDLEFLPWRTIVPIIGPRPVDLCGSRLESGILEVGGELR